MQSGVSPLHGRAVDFIRGIMSGQMVGAENYGVVRGDYNYDFSVRLEGGAAFSNTGILVASANERKAESGSELPLGIKCTWKRRILDASSSSSSSSSLAAEGLLVEIAGISTNMYQISADDIGCKIVVEARLADPNHLHYRGVAIGEIGPFQLDPSTRRSLDNSIGAGGSRFPVTFYKKENEPKQNYMLHVTSDEIKVIQPGMTERFDREISITYSGDYPRVLIHPLDTLKFKLLVDSSTEMHFGSLSRQSRDLIALTIRCFHSRRHIATAALLEQVFSNPINHGGMLNTEDYQAAQLDLCLYTDRLRGELIRQLETRIAIEKQYHKIANEKTFLDDQLHDTITSFTGMIQDLQDQVTTNESAQGGPGVPTDHTSASRLNPDPFFHAATSVPLKKYENLQQENTHLKIELEEQRRQILQEKHKAKLAGNPFGDMGFGSNSSGGAGTSKIEQELQRLKEENRRLLRSQEPSNAEMRRLRIDNDQILQEREELVRRLERADREKAELSSNFVYVKGEYDKLQNRMSSPSGGGSGMNNFTVGGSASSSTSPFGDPFSISAGVSPGLGGGEHSSSAGGRSYRALQEERNRLAQRVEQLTQDAEKAKTSQDQGMERVMTSNARLLEEKDRLQREVERVSRLYADAVNHAAATSAGMGGYGSSDELQQQVRTLQVDSLKKDEKIRVLESENASLKTRIRKLASVT
ncbi:unnamed protein product [Amoebophrya sp. A120]|nr:unnamed protein product [Amoebophrya sp. A120]|eukprot:GSA120T00000763001.1